MISRLKSIIKNINTSRCYRLVVFNYLTRTHFYIRRVRFELAWLGKWGRNFTHLAILNLKLLFILIWKISDTSIFSRTIFHRGDRLLIMIVRRCIWIVRRWTFLNPFQYNLFGYNLEMFKLTPLPGVLMPMCKTLSLNLYLSQNDHSGPWWWYYGPSPTPYSIKRTSIHFQTKIFPTWVSNALLPISPLCP